MASVASVLDGCWEPARERQHHVPGEAGIWFLLFGDMAVFTMLFGVYLQYRAKQPDVFAQSQDTLHRDLGARNTLLLLASSLLVVLATRAVRGASRQLAPRLIVGAFAFGVGFIVSRHSSTTRCSPPDTRRRRTSSTCTTSC